MTQEVVNLRATATASGAALTALQATANAAWDSQAQRMDTLEKELEDTRGLLAQVGNQGPREHFWNLEHKGTLKEYSGDQKSYRPWARRLTAFCNSKVGGFRVALVWAEKIQATPCGKSRLHQARAKGSRHRDGLHANTCLRAGSQGLIASTRRLMSSRAAP